MNEAEKIVHELPFNKYFLNVYYTLLISVAKMQHMSLTTKTYHLKQNKTKFCHAQDVLE